MATSSSSRSLPNILVTGTPATGKTTLCETLLSLSSTSTPPLPLQHLSINDIIKSNDSFHSGLYSSAQQTSKDASLIITDDNLDLLMDHVSSPALLDDGNKGGFILDWHSSSGFAVRWIDLVVVLRCHDTSVLYDRLVARGYGDEKVQENMDAEIFGVVGEEAREAWGEDEQEGDGERVVELKSETAEDIEENAERILAWIRRWVEDRAGDRGAEGKEEG